MKKTYLFILPFLFLSCDQEKELKQEISYLKAQKDSLNTVLDSLKTKFIFDQAFIVNIINDNKPMKEGQEYEGKFYYVAYNLNDKLLFKQYSNSIPDTLNKSNLKGAGYVYNFIAKKGKNNFYFNPLILDKDALEFSNIHRFGRITFIANETVE